MLVFGWQVLTQKEFAEFKGKGKLSRLANGGWLIAASSDEGRQETMNASAERQLKRLRQDAADNAVDANALIAERKRCILM